MWRRLKETRGGLARSAKSSILETGVARARLAVAQHAAVALAAAFTAFNSVVVTTLVISVAYPLCVV